MSDEHVEKVSREGEPRTLSIMESRSSGEWGRVRLSLQECSREIWTYSCLRAQRTEQKTSSEDWTVFLQDEQVLDGEKSRLMVFIEETLGYCKEAGEGFEAGARTAQSAVTRESGEPKGFMPLYRLRGTPHAISSERIRDKASSVARQSVVSGDGPTDKVVALRLCCGSRKVGRRKQATARACAPLDSGYKPAPPQTAPSTRYARPH